MPKLSDEDLMSVPLEKIEAYTDSHPEEAWRFAQLCAKSAIKQTMKAMRQMSTDASRQ